MNSQQCWKAKLERAHFLRFKLVKKQCEGESEQGKQDIGIKSKGFIGPDRVDFKFVWSKQAKNVIFKLKSSTDIKMIFLMFYLV